MKRLTLLAFRTVGREEYKVNLNLRSLNSLFVWSIFTTYQIVKFWYSRLNFYFYKVVFLTVVDLRLFILQHKGMHKLKILIFLITINDGI